MKQPYLVALALAVIAASPVCAQTRLNSVSGPGPTYAYPGMTYQSGTGVYSKGWIPPSAYPYSNYGYGYPGYNPYAFGVPTLTNNGFFQFGAGNTALNMWRAPSGYYYPWAGLPAGYAYSSTAIMYAPNTTTAPTVQQPPISTITSDMVKFIDEAHGKKQVSEGDYEHLRRRVLDLQSKYRDLFSQGNGSLNPEDEQSIRNDLNSVGMEITERVHP